jgi:chromosome segregation ATPase
LTSASKEASTLLKSLHESNGTIDLLRRDILLRDTKIAELSSIISERNNDINVLEQKHEESQKAIENNEVQVSDLTERLKNAMQMNNISQNQELITLKTNLQNSLKVEYTDYLAGKDAEYNKDNFEASLASLTRIFKILRRFGIIID